jgi:glyoxylase-like metal-dependent hydrolase (beta-lactamase superfamily II)
MRIFEDFYVYPWVSYQENNCNTIFIDGEVPCLIDPGHMRLFDHVLEGMAQDRVNIEKVKLILCTHGHPDHIEAIGRFDEEILKGISIEEYAYLNDGYRELYLMTGCELPKKPFALFLKEGTIRLGNKRLRVISTPGHSPGSVSLYWEERRVLISGDTVFYLGVGRTDLFGGNLETLEKSIRKLLPLDIEYLIPGHGDMLKGKKGIQKNFKIILEEFF